MIDKKMRGGLTYGGAVQTYKYLLNERVKEGTAKVLDGDVGLNLKYIKIASKKYSRCWSSGVMSFEESISEAVVREIIDEHKKVTFCGMNKDQYDGVYILHTDKNRTEIHYVFARMELSTGKAFNPYYVRRDFMKKDLFQDYISLKYGLSSPKQFQKRELATKHKKNWASKKSTIQKEIDEAISNLVHTGTIHSREDIIDFLRENDFEINRLRKGSISVKHDSIRKKDGSLDPISLKGAIYGENFTDWDSLEGGIVQEDKRGRRPLKEIKGELDSIIRSQAVFNRERFKRRKAEEQEISIGSESPATRIEHGVSLRKGRREDESCNNKEEYFEENKGRIEHDRVRNRINANARRLGEKARRSREEFEEGKREVLTRAEQLVTGLRTGTKPEQRENIKSIKRAVEQVDRVGKQVEQYSQAIDIERESIRIVEEFGSKMGKISSGVGEWFGEKIETITGQIGVLREKLEKWLKKKPIRDVKKQNEEKRIIKSVIVNDEIEQVSFPKLKR